MCLGGTSSKKPTRDPRQHKRPRYDDASPPVLSPFQEDIIPHTPAITESPQLQRVIQNPHQPLEVAPVTPIPDPVPRESATSARVRQLEQNVTDLQQQLYEREILSLRAQLDAINQRAAVPLGEWHPDRIIQLVQAAQPAAPQPPLATLRELMDLVHNNR